MCPLFQRTFMRRCVAKQIMVHTREMRSAALRELHLCAAHFMRKRLAAGRGWSRERRCSSFQIDYACFALANCVVNSRSGSFTLYSNCLQMAEMSWLQNSSRTYTEAGHVNSAKLADTGGCLSDIPQLFNCNFALELFVCYIKTYYLVGEDFARNFPLRMIKLRRWTFLYSNI
jgi:hypothetical protein